MARKRFNLQQSLIRLLPAVLVLALAGALHAQLPLTDDAVDIYPRVNFTKEQAEQRDGVPREYSGPLRLCPDVIHFREQLGALQQKAINHNLSVLGIPADQVRVLTFICDRSPDGGGDNMSTSSTTIDEQYYGYIRVYASSLVSMRMDSELTYIHEVNHAVLRSYLAELYFPLPKWVREGLAVYCAGQLGHRARVLLAGNLLRAQSLADGARVARKMVDGIEDSHSYADYAESALMIKFLDQQAAGGIPALIKALKAGTSWDEAIPQITGMSLEDYVEAGQTYALQELLNLEAQAYLQVIPVLTALRTNMVDDEKRESEAMQKAMQDARALIKDALVMAEPPYHAAIVAYYLGRAYLALGQDEDAYRLYTTWLADDEVGLSASTLTNIALQRLCEACIKTERYDEATEYAQRLVYGYNYLDRLVEAGQRYLRIIDQRKAVEDAGDAGDAGDERDAGEEERDSPRGEDQPQNPPKKEEPKPEQPERPKKPRREDEYSRLPERVALV